MCDKWVGPDTPAADNVSVEHPVVVMPRELVARFLPEAPAAVVSKPKTSNFGSQTVPQPAKALASSAPATTTASGAQRAKRERLNAAPLKTAASDTTKTSATIQTTSAGQPAPVYTPPHSILDAPFNDYYPISNLGNGSGSLSWNELTDFWRHEDGDIEENEEEEATKGGAANGLRVVTRGERQAGICGISENGAPTAEAEKCEKEKSQRPRGAIKAQSHVTALVQ